MRNCNGILRALKIYLALICWTQYVRAAVSVCRLVSYSIHLSTNCKAAFSLFARVKSRQLLCKLYAICLQSAECGNTSVTVVKTYSVDRTIHNFTVKTSQEENYMDTWHNRTPVRVVNVGNMIEYHILTQELRLDSDPLKFFKVIIVWLIVNLRLKRRRITSLARARSDVCPSVGHVWASNFKKQHWCERLTRVGPASPLHTRRSLARTTLGNYTDGRTRRHSAQGVPTSMLYYWKETTRNTFIPCSDYVWVNLCVYRACSWRQATPTRPLHTAEALWYWLVHDASTRRKSRRSISDAPWRALWGCKKAHIENNVFDLTWVSARRRAQWESTLAGLPSCYKSCRATRNGSHW